MRHILLWRRLALLELIDHLFDNKQIGDWCEVPPTQFTVNLGAKQNYCRHVVCVFGSLSQCFERRNSDIQNCKLAAQK
jgi:hypothetical protein